MIKSVIFDVDGTLVDSNDLHVDAWQDAFRHFGKEIPRDKLREHIGKGGDQYIPAFLDEKELHAFGKELEKFRGTLFKEKYLSRVKPFPKVRDLFERIRDDRKQIVLASSGKADEVGEFTKKLDIEHLIDLQITKDDTERSKPHPDIFEAALQKLDVASPREVIVIGDTPYDAEAAAKAGLPMIGLLCGGFPEAALRTAIALYRDPADLLAQYAYSPIAA